MTAKQRVPADSTLDVEPPADAKASTQIAPGKLCGKLHTDTRTQRGESTGVMIDQMEVDFGRELNAALVTMNGTPLTVTGQMTIRNGITRSPRNVFVVDKVIFVGTLRTELSAVGGTTSSYAINGMCIDFDRSIDLGTVRGSKDRPVTVVGELTICRRLKRPRLVLQVQRLEEAR